MKRYAKLTPTYWKYNSCCCLESVYKKNQFYISYSLCGVCK